jgi:hypothetical protein
VAPPSEEPSIEDVLLTMARQNPAKVHESSLMFALVSPMGCHSDPVEFDFKI